MLWSVRICINTCYSKGNNFGRFTIAAESCSRELMIATLV
jgi:hypothetical protein